MSKTIDDIRNELAECKKKNTAEQYCDRWGHETLERLLLEIDNLTEYRDMYKDSIPDKCPITGRPFFMYISHEDHGWVATYGGPWDSYSIPTRDHDSDMVRMRFDHDEGAWTEECQVIGYFMTDESLSEFCDKENAEIKSDLAEAEKTIKKQADELTMWRTK